MPCPCRVVKRLHPLPRFVSLSLQNPLRLPSPVPSPHQHLSTPSSNLPQLLARARSKCLLRWAVALSRANRQVVRFEAMVRVRGQHRLVVVQATVLRQDRWVWVMSTCRRSP